MVINKEPYFLSNKKWYYYDEEEFCYKLTGEATKEAIKKVASLNNVNKKELYQFYHNEKGE